MTIEVVDAKIQLALNELRQEFAAFRVLDLIRIDHETNQLDNTFTFRFVDDSAVTLTQDDWVSGNLILKAFLNHSIALPVRTNWDVFRAYAMAASSFISRDDAWVTNLEEYVFIRASFRDYLIDPLSIALLKRGTATSIAYGEDARLISLHHFAKFLSKELKKRVPVEMAQNKIAGHYQHVNGIATNIVKVRSRAL